MDFSMITELIGTVGFPIACVIVLGVFIFKIYKDTQAQTKESMEQSKANMEQVQTKCQEREEKLYGFLEGYATTNSKFAEIIARYETKIDEIRADVKEIKEKIN